MSDLDTRPEYYKVRSAVLADIADAIREQRKSSKQYATEEFASIIRRLVCLPAGIAETTLTITSNPFDGLVTGELPVIYKANAASTILLSGGLVFSSTVTGALTE